LRRARGADEAAAAAATDTRRQPATETNRQVQTIRSEQPSTRLRHRGFEPQKPQSPPRRG
jgi:hypothetical protein